MMKHTLIIFIFIIVTGGVFEPRTAAAQKFPEEIAGIRLPDTKLTRAAFNHAQGAYPEWLMNHCLRSYILGLLIAPEIPVTVARKDLMFVGALLHDLPLLGPPFDTVNEPFEEAGAQYSREFMAKHGQSSADTDIVASIVRHHIFAGGVTVPAVQAFNAGIVLDVDGRTHFHNITAAQRKALLTAYPRLDFANQFMAQVDLYAKPHAAAGASHVNFGWIKQIRDYLAGGPEVGFPAILLNSPWRMRSRK